MTDRALRELERTVQAEPTPEAQWDLVRLYMRAGETRNMAHRRVFGVGPDDLWARIATGSGYTHLASIWASDPERPLCSGWRRSKGMSDLLLIEVDYTTYPDLRFALKICKTCIKRIGSTVSQGAQALALGLLPWKCRARQHYPGTIRSCQHCQEKIGVDVVEEPEEWERLRRAYDTGDGPVVRSDYARQA